MYWSLSTRVRRSTFYGGGRAGRRRAKCIPAIPPIDPFTSSERHLDEFDVYIAEASISARNESSRLNDCFVVEAGSVIKNSGYDASAQADLFAVGDIVIGRPAEDEESIGEETDPYE